MVGFFLFFLTVVPNQLSCPGQSWFLFRGWEGPEFGQSQQCVLPFPLPGIDRLAVVFSLFDRLDLNAASSVVCFSFPIYLRLFLLTSVPSSLGSLWLHCCKRWCTNCNFPEHLLMGLGLVAFFISVWEILRSSWPFQEYLKSLDFIEFLVKSKLVSTATFSSGLPGFLPLPCNRFYQ